MNRSIHIMVLVNGQYFNMKNKKQILVTGCSGLVGTHLVHKLLNKGYSVVGIDLKPEFPKKPNIIIANSFQLSKEKMSKIAIKKIKRVLN